jgi:hypothetical protein
MKRSALRDATSTLHEIATYVPLGTQDHGQTGLSKQETCEHRKENSIL